LRKRNLISLPTLLLCIVGCVSQEGIYFENPVHGDKFLAKYGTLPNTPTRPESKVNAEKISWLVAIGRTTPLRIIEEDDIPDLYQEYQEFFSIWQAGRDPFMNFEEFERFVAGWSRVRVLSVPGFYFEDRNTFVPKALVSEVEFANPVGSFLIGDGGDLVAAYTNGDGVYFIERVLCEQGRGYRDCKKKYQIGVFDALTGEILDEKMRPKKNGKDIDPITLEVRGNTE
jgi:hypothetical protein